MAIPVQQGNLPVDQRFNRPPAGWTLTEPKGKWGWEKPPKNAVPAQAVDQIIAKIEQSEATYEQFAKLMFAGVTIEEIVDTIAIGGFMQGEFTPDVAEIIKAPLAIYLLGMAAENDIPVKMFNTASGNPIEESGMDNVQLESLMKENNPSLYEYIEQQAEQEGMVEEEPEEGGFLAVEPATREEDI